MHLVENDLVVKELEKARVILSEKLGVIDSGADDIPPLDPGNSFVLAAVSPEDQDDLIKTRYAHKSVIYNGFYATEGFSDVPESPGIYTVWAQPNDLFSDEPEKYDAVPVYVGQSTSLARRLNPKTHEKIKNTLCFKPFICWVIWAECKTAMLDFAECHYIAKLRPRLNFGNNAKWLVA